MRITFDVPTAKSGVDKSTTSQGLKEKKNITDYQAIALDISGKVTDDFSFGDQGGLPGKVMQAVDSRQYVALQRNYMTVMSNSMSTKDFQKLREEGFDAFAMDPEAVVTIVDKIKAALVQSGTQIQGYTDDLSVEQLKEAVGSRGYARSLKHSESLKHSGARQENGIVRELSHGDVPITEETKEQVEKAVELSRSLQEPSEEALGYMVSRGMEPTLSNFYQAAFSAGKGNHGGGALGYASGGYDRMGYGSIRGSRTVISKEEQQKLEQQIESRIQESGLEVTEETKAQGKWLVEKGIPLTKENLELLDRIEQISFPMKEDWVIRQAVSALAEGQSPADRNLTEEGTIYTKAVEYKNYYENLSLTGSSKEEVEARRVLEEVRLRMTVEANLKLLESGFSIDTAPMEELITRLEDASREWEESLFGAGEASRGKGDLYRNTLEQLQKLPHLPLAVVGRIPSMERPTLEAIGQEGSRLAEQYKAAQESYETLMTAPRRDLGDSIQKAFRNVDDILESMELTVTEENRRAVRILGYNHMEITSENLEKVKLADGQIQDLMKRMKPAVTLELIRKGKNPLEMSLSELNEYLDQEEGSLLQETEKYSKFLYKLEKNSEISEAERKAYIGVYRLLRQIEKSDGAVIGSLVGQGAELNLSNLLSAARSRKAKHTDIQVDDSVGVTAEVKEAENSISAQITTGVEEVRRARNLYRELEPEQLQQENEAAEVDSSMEEAFLREQLREVRQIVTEDSKWEAYLKDYHQTPTLNALQSVAVLNEKRGTTFRRVAEWEEKGASKLMEKANRLLEGLEQEEARVQQYEEMITTAESLLETAVDHMGEEAQYIDVKEIQMLCKQLNTARGLAREENFEIPMQIGGEITSVNLKILHRKESSGEVKITMDCETYGKVEARFQATPDGLEGSILTDYMDGKEALEQKQSFLTELLNEALEEEKIEVKSLVFGTNEKLDLNRLEKQEEGVAVSTGLLYKAAKGFLTFIRMEDVYEN